MTDDEYRQWLREQEIDFFDVSEPSDENLCRLVSHALRSLDAGERAQYFIDVANMSLALADKTLGAFPVIPQCLVLRQH